MRIFFIAGDDKGSGYYRMKLPAKYLAERHESFHVVSPFTTNRNYEKTDIVVYQRQHGEVLTRIKEEQSNGKKIIYEVDDNLWHIPSNCGHFTSYWTPERVKSAESLISASDRVVTSTEVIADDVKRFNKNVFVRPNYIEMPPLIGDTSHIGKIWDVSPLWVGSSTIRIGWAGCPSHKPDFDNSIIQALRDIKNKYRDKVELIFLGWIPNDLIGIATFYRYVLPEGYMNFLKDLRLNIGIIPCQINRFNDSRSNLKFLEFSAIKAVSIASPVYPYRNIIKDGSGFLVKKNRYHEWYKTISILIEDMNLRDNISQNAYNFVKENYQIKDKIDILEETYLF